MHLQDPSHTAQYHCFYLYTTAEKRVQETNKFSILSALYSYKSFFMLDNYLTYPTHLTALISPKFDFHLQLDLLHNHTKIMMVCNLGGSPLSSACLQGQFDIMRKHVATMRQVYKFFSTPTHRQSQPPHRTQRADNGPHQARLVSEQ